MIKRNTIRDAEAQRRSNIPTIRDYKVRTDIDRETSSQIFLHIEGAVEYNLGKEWEGNVASMHLANASGAPIDIAVSVAAVRSTEPNLIYIVKDVTIPHGSTLVLLKEDLKIDDTGSYYRIIVNESPQHEPMLDVIIRL